MSRPRYAAELIWRLNASTEERTPRYISSSWLVEVGQPRYRPLRFLAKPTRAPYMRWYRPRVAETTWLRAFVAAARPPAALVPLLPPHPAAAIAKAAVAATMAARAVLATIRLRIMARNPTSAV